MAPVCTLCGQEVTFIPQYQQWYCHGCGRYPYIQLTYAAQPASNYQQPAAQPMSGQPPAFAPTEASARSRIFSSISMRANTDRVISTGWVGAIIALQLLFPVMALALVYWLVLGTYDIAEPGMLILISLVIVAAMILVILHGMLVYRLVSRRDDHFKRDAILRVGMEEYLSALSLDRKIDLNVERWTMNTISQGNSDYERSPLTWAMLVCLIAIIPLVGAILLLYCQAFLTSDVQSHADKQKAYNHFFQQGLLKAGKISQPMQDLQPLPKRDTAAYTILTILTIGFFLPYWWYVNIQDMNAHLKDQSEFENWLVQLLQAEG